MGELSLQNFTEQIESRAAGVGADGQPLNVADEIIHIEDGVNVAEVRLAGGYILGCFLENDDDPSKSVPVLYAGTDVGELAALPKINASHFMSPIGPQPGLGGQHGVYRYADYKRLKAMDSDAYVETGEDKAAEISSYLAIESQVSPEFPRHVRSMTTQDGDLHIRDILFNTGQELYTSAGQHLYWVLTADPSVPPSAEGFRITDDKDQPLFTDQTIQKAFDGDSQYIPNLQRAIHVHFPDGREFLMDVTASLFSKERKRIEAQLPIGLLLWRRQGTNSICVEPTVGLEWSGDGPISASKVHNQGLVLPPSAILDLHTHILTCGHAKSSQK